MSCTGPTIDLRDAARMQGPVAFQVMVKPVGPRCNLGCSYCYYLAQTGRDNPGHSGRMSESLLEKLIREAVEADDSGTITFTWHGGEPLLAGLPFFRRALAMQHRYAAGKTFVNTVQTNGTLLNAEWASFFRDNGFLVGLSLDGPRDLHDAYRRDRGGRPAFDQVMRGLEHLHRAGTDFNTLTTINLHSEGRGGEVYRFLRGCGSRYLQFLPVSEPGNPVYNVSAAGFGQFLHDVFSLWVRHDVGETFVSQFDAVLCCWCGIRPGTCVFARTCADVLTVEQNGDVYACDHFVDSAHKLGNLAGQSLQSLLGSPLRSCFVTDKTAQLPADCQRCPWLPACYGGCPQHRTEGRNRLCAGYRFFLERTAPFFDEMRRLLETGREAADIRQNSLSLSDKPVRL